nr:MAG TPA: tail tape measure protein [Caudoviricetes sp.]
MPKLYFKVGADYENVIRLRDEITKLKQTLGNINAVQSPTMFNAVNAQLKEASVQLRALEVKGAEAGAVMDRDFKKKIYDASNVVNGLTSEIIEQKKIIASTKEDIRQLTEKYQALSKYERVGSPITSELKKAKDALSEQNYALFELSQQQATARLSVKQLRDEYALFKDEGKEVALSVSDISNSFKKAFGVVAGISSLEQLISKIIDVRGQFQQADTAIQTMLGSKEKADALLAKVREYATVSPLEFGDITSATQMMLGFNIEAEKIPRFIEAIGDVSMGNSQKFNSLSLAFSQMSATGKLMGQDLNQMINAGFNPLSVMAEKSGKSIATLKKEMSDGKITTEMVQQAFIDATSAGGKFYNMSENASKTISGQMSMLSDAIDSALNNMGKSSEGMIMKGIKAATTLVQDYERIGKVIGALLVTYGLYKTAVMVATAAENGHRISMMVMRAQVLLNQKAVALLNTTMLANPYVLVAVAIGALITKLAMMKTHADLVREAQERYNEEKQKAIDLENEHKAKVDGLLNIASDEALSTENRKEALVRLSKQYPDIFAKYKTETEMLNNILNIKNAIAEADGRKTVTNPLNGIKDIDKKLKELGPKSGMSKGMSNWATIASYVYAPISPLIPIGVGKLTGKAAAKNTQIDQLNAQKAQLTKQIQDAQSDKYFADLSKQNISTIKKEIATRKNLIAKAKLQNKRYGTITTGGSKGTFSLDDLQGQIGILERNLNERTQKKQITKTSLVERKKQLQDQLDHLTYEEAVGKKGAELKRKIEEIRKKEQAYSSSETPQKGKNAQKDAETDSKRIRERSEALEKARKDIEDAAQQRTLDAMEEGSEKTLRKMELDHKREMEQIEQQRKDLLKAKTDEAEAKFKAKNKKGKFDRNSVKLTEEEENVFKNMQSDLEAKQKREKEDMYKAELQSMYDYLKEYGTIQQQRYAIAKEYDDKIAKEADANRKLSLQREKENALAKADANKIAMDIDWGASFEGIGNVLKDIAKETLKEVEAYMKTADFKKLSPESKKSYVDLRDNLRKEGAGDVTSPFNLSVWGEVAELTKNYQDSVRKFKDAQAAHTQAVDILIAAENNLAKATDDTQKAMAQKAVEMAQINVQKTAEVQGDAGDNMRNAKSQLTDTANSASQGLKNFSDTIGEMSKGTLSGFANGISKLVTSLGKGSDGVGKTLGELGGKVGGIIGAILQIIDALGDAPASFIEGLLNKVAKVVETVISELPQIIVTILKGVVNIIAGLGKGILKMVGLGDLFGGSDNHAKQLAIQKEISKKIDIINTSIDKLKDKLGKSYGMEAVKTKQELDKVVASNQSKYAQGVLEAGWDNYGGGHSDWYHWNKNTKNMAKDIARTYGMGNVGSWEDFFTKLGNMEGGGGAKILDKIRTEHGLDWWYMMQTGGYNDGKIGEWLTKWADSAKTIEEAEERLKERITGTTFDDVFGGLLNSLNDFANGSKDVFDDVAKNWQKMINKMVINNIIGSKLQEDAKKVYDMISKAYDPRTNTINKKALDEAKALQDASVRKGTDIINAYKSAGLIKDPSEMETQKATINEERSLSDDTGTRIEGRLTAIQIAVERANGVRDTQNASLSLMNATLADVRGINMQMCDIANENRDILANSYLELKEISRNTGESEKHLREMKQELQEVKRIIKNA